MIGHVIRVLGVYFFLNFGKICLREMLCRVECTCSLMSSNNI